MHDKRDKLLMPVALVVLLGWVASLIAGFFTQSYVALTVTTPLMLMLSGYVFGVNIVRKGSDQ